MTDEPINGAPAVLRHVIEIKSLTNVRRSEWPRMAEVIAWIASQEPGIQQVARLFPVRSSAIVNRKDTAYVIGYENTGDETSLENVHVKMSFIDPRISYENALEDHFAMPWQKLAEAAEREGVIQKVKPESGIVVPPGSDDPRLIH